MERDTKLFIIGSGVGLGGVSIQMTGAPHWVGWAVVLVGMGVAAFPFIAHRLSLDPPQHARGDLRDALTMPQGVPGPVDREATRAVWGEFRAYGVELRNLASMQAFSPDAWDDWQETVTEWNTKVVASIRTVGAADAHWFATLDSVPPPRIQPEAQWMNQAQLRLYRVHDYRVKRLGDLIEQYRPKGPAVWGE